MKALTDWPAGIAPHLSTWLKRFDFGDLMGGRELKHVAQKWAAVLRQRHAQT
ncbi:hypothetical protein [Rhizobium leguminosarum]|uniref:hypothetical protein n=1 Tax=Rhizobium leguminosarum TaxID=384 RepID=UPI0024A9D9AC|nr:hypothetical protein [Rhizobium leguminosarum]MDI5927918.1 hypothetical protein [Rhizobium leguminosarum]